MNITVRMQELGGNLFVTKQVGDIRYEDIGYLRKSSEGYFIVADHINVLVPITKDRYIELKTYGCFS